MELELDLLEVAEVADGCWRICDRSIPADDAARILACAQVAPDGVYVAWLCVGVHRVRYPTLDDVLAVCSSVVFSRENDRRRPVPIAHFASPAVAATEVGA